MSMMTYCTKLKIMADKLCDLGSPVTESDLVLTILRSLNPHIAMSSPSSRRIKHCPPSSRYVHPCSLRSIALNNLRRWRSLQLYWCNTRVQLQRPTFSPRRHSDLLLRHCQRALYLSCHCLVVIPVRRTRQRKNLRAMLARRPPL